MKYLTMTGFTVRTGSDRWTLGYEGENNSRTLQIKTTDDLTDFATVNLLIDTLDCGAMTVTTVGNFKVLSMVLTAGMLGEAGKKTCQLLMMDSEGTVIKKTNQFQMVVNTSNTVDGMAPDSPTAIIITDYIDDAVNERVSDEFLEGKINDWLDEHPEATTTVQDGSLTEAKFSNALKLKTIKDYVTPEMYGAVGDGVTDDTTALQSAINNGNTVVLGNKTYKITDTITLRSNLTIEGLNRNLSKIVFYGSSDKELFISTTSGNTTNLKLKNFTIEDTAERSVFLIDIPNSYPIEINGCTIAGYSSAQTQNYKGVRLYATSNSHSYLAKIINNRFTRCQLTMDSRVTDAYIAFNELWGQCCECALFVNGGSNMMITNNQIVGGRVYGGIRIEHAINASINDNYFDGSINELDTKCGIYSENGIIRSCVVGNKFWNYRSFGIYAPNSGITTITGNVFDDCDFFNNAVPDVYIDNAHSISYIGNVHRRSQYYDTETNTIKNRTSEMKQPPIILKNRGSGYPGSVVSGNVCVFSNFYSNAVYTTPIVAQINGSSQFDYTP